MPVDIHSQYNIVLNLEGCHGEFSEEEFYDLIAVFSNADKQSQQETFDLFAKLPRQEMLRRAAAVAKLTKALANIRSKGSYAISG